MPEDHVTPTSPPSPTSPKPAPKPSGNPLPGRSGNTVQRFQRGSKEVEHDLFKLKVAKMIRNFSWIWRKPMLSEIEHVHHFHSVNDTTLQPNKTCSPVGNHHHECTVDWTKKGPDGVGPLVTVGPPLRMGVKKIGGGRTIRKAEPIVYERLNENNGELERIVDTHTHEVEYLGSETFTQKSRNENRLDEQRKVRELMQGAPVRQAGAMADLHTGPAADKVKGVLQEGAETTQGTGQ